MPKSEKQVILRLLALITYSYCNKLILNTLNYKFGISKFDC